MTDKKARVRFAAHFPAPQLSAAFTDGAYHAGATEPWVQRVVESLLLANGGDTVIELGTYKGHTSAVLCLALERLGGGTFIGAELREDWAQEARALLKVLTLPSVQWQIVVGKSVDVVNAQSNDSIDFAWIDSDHNIPYLKQELTALQPKLRNEAIVTGHDVTGTWALAPAFIEAGGIALNFPWIHAGGGLGILQAPYAVL